MSKKLELILQLTLAVIIIMASLRFLYMYGGKFLHIYKLKDHGVLTKAEIRMKGVLTEGELELRDSTLPSDNHLFLVNYTGENGNDLFCRLPVSKNRYDSHKYGDFVSVSYHPSDPGRCMLVSEIEFNYGLLSFIAGAGLFFLLLGSAFIYYIYRHYRKPLSTEPAGLTTSFGRNEMNCPECGSLMDEGYIPVTGGITWRDRDESTGIPTIMSGLPGTVFWLKRPRLHSFRCRKCKNVIFRHG